MFFSNKPTKEITSKNVLRIAGRNISDLCGGRIQTVTKSVGRII